MASSSGVYIVIDVEMIDANKWLSMCFLTAHYPTGKILAVEEFYVDRSKHKIQCPKKIAFWEQHTVALDYNIRRGIGIQEEDVEQSICEYVNELRSNIPHFFLVSDNPVLDVAVVDAILLKYGHPPLSNRNAHMYAQVLCTWSYKQALAKQFHVRSPSKLFSSPAVCRLLGSAVDSYASRPIRQVDISSTKPRANPLPPHTVFRDCCVTLASFFRCLDLSTAMGRFVEFTLLAPVPISVMPQTHQTTDMSN